MNDYIKRTIVGVAVFALPALAYAHTGVGDTSGFMHGFGHPISGIDHILPMVMVGVFAFQLGGRAIWLVPTTFVMVMAVGGGLGIAGIDVPFVETGIALSVVVLGAVVALRIKAPTAVAMGLVALFAIFHGHAHGAEMPENEGGAAYGAGFMLATAILHVAGITIGFVIARVGERRGQIFVRATGGLAAIAGIGILTRVL